MAAAAQGAYPQPPGVVGQDEQAPPPQSVFSAEPSQPQAPGQNPAQQVLQQIQGKLQELDSWASDMKIMLDQYDKSLSVFLQPIAQAGLQLTKALQEKAQRSGVGQQSPVVPPPNTAGAAGGEPTPRGV